MKYTDLQIADKTLWNQLQIAWANNQYDVVYNILQENNLLLKCLNAKNLNDLTETIVELEQTSDPTFKQDKIPCQEVQPTQQNGEVWFQIE